MTNLLAAITICIVTNMVEVDNATGCLACEYGMHAQIAEHWQSCTPYIPPTEKTETTTIKEVHSLKFTWRGMEYTAKSEKVLSETIQRWIKKEAWAEQNK